MLNEWTNTAPMGAAEPFQLRLSVRILAEDCSFLRSKTKGKNTKGKMATACLWSTLIATWAGPLLYSSLEVSRVPPAECWLQTTGQEPSKRKWGHFFLHIISFLCIPFIQPQTPYFLSFDLAKDIFQKIKGYVSWLAEENCLLSYLEATCCNYSLYFIKIHSLYFIKI